MSCSLASAARPYIQRKASEEHPTSRVLSPSNAKSSPQEKVFFWTLPVGFPLQAKTSEHHPMFGCRHASTLLCGSGLPKSNEINVFWIFRIQSCCLNPT